MNDREDVNFAGTPAGVGAATGHYMQSGDETVVRIGSLDTLIKAVHRFARQFTAGLDLASVPERFT
jgi:hypothetical protein